MWRGVSNNICVQQYRSHRYTFITVVSLSVILLSFFVTYSALAGDTVAAPTLKFIHVVFRHGFRTPTYSFKNDPHKNYIWSEGKGALTTKGKLQLFKVGEALRNRYDKFLGEFYSPEEIEVQSSYAPRCQMSAQTFLAGLFPPKGRQVWNPALNWQPIPVNPIPRSLDNKIAAKAKCREYEIEKKKSDQELLSELSDEEVGLFNYLSQHTGEEIKDLSHVDSLYYTLKIENDQGLPLPNWTNHIFPVELERLAQMNLASYSRTELLKRLQAGPMLKEWITNMKEHHVNPQKKAHFYSGHDLTIVSLLKTLGFDNMDMPGYGATLIIEYHESNDALGEGTVEIYYLKKRESTQFHQMKLPFCEMKCPLATFSNNLNKYVPSNWDLECKNSK